jgi:predicted DNA-binding transcriptional regulator AlpA
MADDMPPPVAPTAEGLWNVDDVAAFLRVSRRSVYDLPGLPKVRLAITGRRALVRFLPAEVRAWAAARLTHTLQRSA